MRLTIRDVQKMKANKQPIVVITAYDATSARVAERAEIPLILVGDTLGMVVQGHTSTVPVTLEHSLYHASIVTRVTQKPLIIGDMPFMTYNLNPEQALTNAARFMQEAGVTCVKIEGGVSIAPTIRRLVEAGIPVMAHVGLTPQSVNTFGGFRVQGREIDSARQVVRDALAVQEAGAFAVVLELVPAKLAAYITKRLEIPTIGIGAGTGCDGQVQVFHDLLGLFDAFLPKHTKRYAEIGARMQSALVEYREDVEAGRFPSDVNAFSIDDEIIRTLESETSL